MELILWRHAEAEDGTPDLARKLTTKGLKQADSMATFLRPLLPQDMRILVSPAQRTLQTVQALIRHAEIEPIIAPGASPHALLKAAGWPDSAGCVLLVGHQPSLGQTAAMLMEAPSSACFSVKKGAIWWLSRRERDGGYQTSLRLVIAPDFI